MAQSTNIIKQIAIRELLDGRWFYIPSYQRGYRWTKTQIYDLCNDLLEYALRKNKDPKAFYSLQPLIVRRSKKKIQDQEREVYEVIDGQQRLTSIYILLCSLMCNIGCQNKEDLEEKKGIKLYNLYYETRPYDYAIFDKLGGSVKMNEIKDIDVAHIVNACNYVKQWLTNKSDTQCAKYTWELFSEDNFNILDVATSIINLLTNNQNTQKPEGNAQFIWYEIDSTKDPIQEFLSENKGKIQLTDTEKIRGLFMQRRGKEDVKSIIQHGIAKDWELIENTLHNNHFWSFISNDVDKEDGRINLIFQYLYDRDCEDKTYKGDDYLFRYYYQLFNSQSNPYEDYSSMVDKEWRKVMAAFRMLQNWYQNPRVYNLVGLLTKEQTDKPITTKDIADIYDAPDVVTTEDFITKLKEKVCKEIIDKIPIDKDGNVNLDIEGEYIKLFFNVPSDKKKIPGLLRFINVNILCEQIEKLLEDVDKPDEEKKASDMGRSNRDEQCSIYRFPYEALDAFGWDIEHIDSATTNTLMNEDEQKKWIEESETALGDLLQKDEDYVELKKKFESTEIKDKTEIISNILNRIRYLIGEDDSAERKNWIGNLTLLDSGTNRMYQNKIFAIKRSIIHDRVSRGVFVPVCTQNIFNKTYESCTKDNLRWDINDKKCYHKFILDQIKTFKDKYHK